MKNKIENRVWIRIINSCNSKCIFCLDSNSEKDKIIEDELIKGKIKDGFKHGFFNKIIISGGEASLNPKFIEYINFAQKIGYQKIQTITNGQMFSKLDFCKKTIESGINEVTFSIHGHTSKLHDFLSGVPGSFKKALTGLINFKKYFPQIIINIDIVVNKINIDYIPDIIKFFNKLGVYEFDLLQIIPFGRAEQNKNILFYDPFKKINIFTQIGDLSKIPGMHIWTNRLSPEVLEGYENLIQKPSKIKGEVTGESNAVFSSFISSKGIIKPECFGEKCKYCFINNYCNDFIKNQKKDKLENIKEFFIIKGEYSINQIYEKFGEKDNNFLSFLKNIDKQIINIPKCLLGSGLFQTYNDLEPQFTLIDYTDKFINNLYMKKSIRCKECKYNNECKGIHINFIRAYGFKILQPIIR